MVPVSGGGLISGIAAAVKAIKPTCRIIAAEPAGKGLQDALSSSTRVVDPEAADRALDTIADAIRTRAFGLTPWAVAEYLLESTVLAVDDTQIRSAMLEIATELKQVVEPAGAVAFAAVRTAEFGRLCKQHGLKNVGVVVCGGNVDPDHFANLVLSARAC